MKVQSTGLGKTVMIARFKELLKTDFDSQQVLQLNMEATEPLHWTIKVYLEPKDIRLCWQQFLAAIPYLERVQRMPRNQSRLR